ncbi:MAG: SusE domain-containing protein [Saprospiraceae bacterium]|nr:SusE domain-containing protein [Saprospiraceae bacterium]
MKKYLVPVLFAALLIGSCGKGEFDPLPVLKVGDAPALTAPDSAASIVLLEANANDPFVFTWTAADFNFDAAVSYTVEVDKAGNNFADPVTIGTSNGLSLDNALVSKVNNILVSKGFPGEEPGNVEVRLAAKVNPEVPTVYSSAVPVTITPYTVVIVYPKLQVPGSYQGWNPADENTVIFSAKSDSKFEGFIYFKDPNSEFKYTDGPSWDTNYGDTGADGSLEKNGDNIKLADAGMYRLNANLNDLTHSFVKTDWGLIGSATPDQWNSDQNMTYDPVANKWTITLNLVAGEIKFRANDDWAINFGDDGANKSLEYGAANIAVAEDGNYTIDLILSGAVYTYKIKKN